MCRLYSDASLPGRDSSSGLDVLSALMRSGVRVRRKLRLMSVHHLLSSGLLCFPKASGSTTVRFPLRIAGENSRAPRVLISGCARTDHYPGTQNPADVLWFSGRWHRVVRLRLPRFALVEWRSQMKNVFFFFLNGGSPDEAALSSTTGGTSKKYVKRRGGKNK